MCVIIIKKDDKILLDEVVLKSVSLNPDGFGITFLDTWETHRTLDMREAAVMLKSQRPFVSHCRKGTVGDTNMDNVHPVRIKKGFELFHNGTVSIPTHKNESDTKALAKFISRYNPLSNDMRIVLEMTDSRFVITDKTSRQVHVFNKGFWTKSKEDVWFSKSNVLKGTFFFSYDTTKKGFTHSPLLKWDELLCKGVLTKQKFHAIGHPFADMSILEDYPKYFGEPKKHIKGELYLISDGSEMAINGHYKLRGGRLVDVIVEYNGMVVKALTPVYPMLNTYGVETHMSELLSSHNNKLINATGFNQNLLLV